MVQKLIQVGDSLAFILSPEFVEECELKVGDKMGFLGDVQSKDMIFTTVENAKELESGENVFDFKRRIEARYGDVLRSFYSQKS